MMDLKLHPSYWVQTEAWRADFEMPLFQSHRGFHQGGMTENTLEAFRESKKLGFTMIECDVQLSADGVPVIYHDATLDRLHKDPSSLHSLDVSELKRRAGITTLQELLLDPYVPDLINIEIKTDDIFEEKLERKIAEVVKECRSQGKVLFSSFNPVSLWKMQGFLPKVPRALLVGKEGRGFQHFLLKNMLLAPLLKIHCLNLETTLLSADSMRLWNKKDTTIAAWTVRKSTEIPLLKSWGVKSIITDLGSEAFIA